MLSKNIQQQKTKQKKSVNDTINDNVNPEQRNLSDIFFSIAAYMALNSAVTVLSLVWNWLHEATEGNVYSFG